ncbi:MAG TPA: acyl-CoA dehydrogenase family protein [Xanthomonadales bacterium]|nr:acyl-CoA dehydrogenase family protein [Xanthomonadales bacterium]
MRNPFETDERLAFRDMVRDFVAREIRPHADAWDEAGEVPWELHRKAGALGLFGFGIDERFGGLGFDDAFMRATYAEEISQCGATGVPADLGARSISVGPIHLLGSEEIKLRVLPGILSGQRGASLAITEPSGGSDVAALRTRAARDGNDYVLNGEKTFITGGMRSDFFVVAARTGGEGLTGISLLLVEADTPGFSRQPLPRKMGWWCSDTASLFFDDCRVPAGNLLGPENRGFLAVMENFNFERFFMAAQCLGMMQACLDDAAAWARERKTFGKQLIEHQVIRHKLADMSARIDAARALIREIAWNINQGEVPVAEISKAKVFASKGLEFCASEAMQILGGAGFLRGNRIERIYREVKVMAIGGGSEEILRDLAARQMGL